MESRLKTNCGFGPDLARLGKKSISGNGRRGAWCKCWHVVVLKRICVEYEHTGGRVVGKVTQKSEIQHGGQIVYVMYWFSNLIHKDGEQYLTSTHDVTGEEIADCVKTGFPASPHLRDEKAGECEITHVMLFCQIKSYCQGRGE